jgi:hypothetical protein
VENGLSTFVKIIGDRVRVFHTCPRCNKGVFPFSIKRAQYYEIVSGGRNIQEIAPNLSAEQREYFLTGYCGPCRKELFPPEEDE